MLWISGPFFADFVLHDTLVPNLVRVFQFGSIVNDVVDIFHGVLLLNYEYLFGEKTSAATSTTRQSSLPQRPKHHREHRPQMLPLIFESIP